MVPHPPQLFGSVPAMKTSHPSIGMPLQSAKPVLHVYVHVGLLQPLVVFGRDGHTVPHPPQLFGSDWTFTSQPSALFALQFEKPMAHWIVQLPP